MLVSEFSASAPLTLLTANQPMPAMTALSPAGSALPNQPNEMRESTICGTPYSGPRAESTAWVNEPSPVPMRMASAAWPNDRPKIPVASTPRKTVANSRLGESQVHSSWSGLPCRSEAGTNSEPPGSTAMTFAPYSPGRTSATTVSDCGVVLAIDDSLSRRVLRGATVEPFAADEVSPRLRTVPCLLSLLDHPFHLRQPGGRVCRDGTGRIEGVPGPAQVDDGDSRLDRPPDVPRRRRDVDQVASGP